MPSVEGRALTDLRFYVHSIALSTDRGPVEIALAPDERWQSASVALIDLEDGTGVCLNGTAERNASIRGTVRMAPDANVSGVRFEIGVPEERNHADPMTAAAPLNYTIMHWHWRSGYKFMRAGVATANDSAWLHLGSSRCEGTIGAIEGCSAPNRPVVDLPGFEPGDGVVVVDVARLFGPSLLGDGEPWDCQSGPDERQCRVVFAELGLDFDSGATMGPAPIFYVGSRQ